MRQIRFILFFLWASGSVFAQDQKPTIVYIFDPICSWCYTFNPIIEKLHIKYKHKLDFSVVSGGMVTGEKIRPISDVAEYILAGYQDMQNMTDVVFGKPYIDMVKQGTERIDSERPSYAVTAFRKLDSSRTVEFAHDLQLLYFYKGYSLNQDSTYLHLAKMYNLDGKIFLETMDSEEVKTTTQQDFKRVDDSGIGGFPTVLLRIKGRVILITEGFDKLEKLEKKIDKALKEHNG